MASLKLFVLVTFTLLWISSVDAGVYRQRWAPNMESNHDIMIGRESRNSQQLKSLVTQALDDLDVDDEVKGALIIYLLSIFLSLWLVSKALKF